MPRVIRKRARTKLSLGAALLFLAARTLAQDTDLGISSVDSTLPQRLSETGLYEAGTTTVRAGIRSFTPQYPLWSDGASKRRWLYLPPGTSIDGADMDAWDFPAGTRTWKEFRHGRRVETRYVERLADGSWRYAAYAWNADESDALLVAEHGMTTALPGDMMGETYRIPSEDDCRACHEGSAVPVLGFSALQLAADRDAQALHAEVPRPGDVDLPALLESGLLRNVAAQSIDGGSSLPATTAMARTALGYLHGNCGHCHNRRGPLADLGLDLAQGSADREAEARVAQSIVDRRADARVLGLDTRVRPGRPDESQLLARMKSANAYNRMPPLGTALVDEHAVEIIEKWIQLMQNGKGDSL